MEEEMRSRHIPKTDSIEELAQFWDTHDLTDFEDDLEDVTQAVFIRGESVTVPIKLNVEDVRVLKRIAESKGVEERTLLRRWIRERLRKSS